MITVRFPTGYSVQYNDGYTINNNFIVDKEGAWIANVPAGAIVECVAPCRTYNDMDRDSFVSLRTELAAIRRKLNRVMAQKSKRKGEGK